MLSDNGPQFAIKLYQNTFRILGIVNNFTSAYHPLKNGHVKHFNRSIAAMLRLYVSDHPENCDEYAQTLTNADNLNMHCPTGTRPLDHSLYRPLPEFKLIYEDYDPLPTKKDCIDFAEQLQRATENARTSIDKAQRRYKSDYDKGTPLTESRWMYFLRSVRRSV